MTTTQPTRVAAEDAALLLAQSIAFGAGEICLPVGQLSDILAALAQAQAELTKAREAKNEIVDAVNRSIEPQWEMLSEEVYQLRRDLTAANEAIRAVVPTIKDVENWGLPGRLGHSMTQWLELPAVQRALKEAK